MCNVPPKFYQVCRLCLTVVSDNDLIKLSIYPTLSPAGRTRRDSSSHNDATDDSSPSSPKSSAEDEGSESKNDAQQWKKVKLEDVGEDLVTRKTVVESTNNCDRHVNDDHRRDVDATMIDGSQKDVGTTHLTNGGSHDIPERIYQCLSITVSFIIPYLYSHSFFIALVTGLGTKRNTIKREKNVRDE